MKKLLPLFILLLAATVNAETFTVTRSDDRDELCVSGANCSLREAVKAANLAPTDDVINFTAGITKIALTDQLFIENAGSLTINGLGAKVFTIGNTTPPTVHRIFNINAVVTITDATISGGWLQRLADGVGAGILVNGGTLVLDRVQVSGNVGFSLPGGGIVYAGGANHRIINSAIVGNAAFDSSGGFSGSPYVANTTISGNSLTSARQGARGSAFQGSPVLRNVTIAYNEARLGSSVMGNPDMRNTILMDNLLRNNPKPPCQILNSNLIGDCDISQVMGPLQDNGGPTLTHALPLDSLALDAGDNAFAVDPFSISALLTDQRGFGFLRIADGNGDGLAIVDIGAFEVQDLDADDDGIPDNVDPDDDNDGQADVDEIACGSNPLSAASRSLDTDADNAPDCVDADDDNDGVLDASDAFPLDPNESVDTDGDGVGNNADADDDNDGQSDADEIACGSNPLDAASRCAPPPTGAPTNINQCKNGGWTTFTEPRRFRNQGDCIRFVNTGR